MLRLTPEGPVETLWDALLPAEVRVLPEDWARIDERLSDSALLVPFQTHWQANAVRATGRPAKVYLDLSKYSGDFRAMPC